PDVCESDADQARRSGPRATGRHSVRDGRGHARQTPEPTRATLSRRTSTSDPNCRLRGVGTRCRDSYRDERPTAITEKVSCLPSETRPPGVVPAGAEEWIADPCCREPTVLPDAAVADWLLACCWRSSQP